MTHKENVYFGKNNILQPRQRNNELTAVPLLPPLPKLISLQLQANQISAIETGAFKKITKISNLFLQDNQLQTLSKGMFASLKSVKTISLQKNIILKVDRHLSKNVLTFLSI